MLMAEHFAIQMSELRSPLFPGFTDRAKENVAALRLAG